MAEINEFIVIALSLEFSNNNLTYPKAKFAL